ncbi:Alpha/Beta hydrolase protein [Mycena alexandri]|uniref:Alpha/Beta hydrolase protein n=1 Tax=Mycena alexandri TaxID=1745969 RepID=A0AAD6S6Q9_9AGAR|nr:Alpha/Beta hydrolase protein [Mycena alexandri]
MSPSASRCLAYLLLIVPPLVISFYLLASFPTPPSPLSVPAYPGLASLPPESRAREIYPENWLEEGGYVDLPMGRTRYWLRGPKSGKKIVLIHGLSIPALVWAPLVPQLVDAGHRVLLYDLYGRGYSDAPIGAAYDAQLYVTQLALLLQHVGWQRSRIIGVSMGGAIAAAFVATFPNLVEREVVLVASAGLVESADLPRTAKVMSSPFVQALTANPLIYAYLRRLASKPDATHEPRAALIQELVRHQSAHLAGFNRAVSSSLRTGPVTGMRWAFESKEWVGRRVLAIHGTADHTVPPAHTSRIKMLIEAAGRNTSTEAPNSERESKRTTQTKGKAWEEEERVRVARIPDAGHALTWTHADEVGKVMCQFLAGR